jgi:hypothetical protein
MLRGNSLRLAVLACLSLLLAACGGAPGEPAPDRVGTRVAEDLAVARTLTAVAQNSSAPTQIALASTPTVAASAAPVSFPTPIPPTETPLPPTATNTAVPPTRRPPTATPVPPTSAPVVSTPLDDDPTAPGFGTPNGLEGTITLPGYQGPLDVPVFRNAIAFRLKVNDPAFGNADGSGIKSVTMSIDAPNGQVHIRTEQNAAYCVFGNPSDSAQCNIWRFSEHNNQWPDGTPVCAGTYQGNMTVETDDSAKSGAFWGFNFEIAGDYPSC